MHGHGCVDRCCVTAAWCLQDAPVQTMPVLAPYASAQCREVEIERDSYVEEIYSQICPEI